MSAGKVPLRVGRRSFQRETNAELRQKLNAALKRLGVPDLNYRHGKKTK